MTVASAEADHGCNSKNYPGNADMHDFLDLQDKVAVVWGGGAGMGEATVKQLAKAGCAVGVVDIDGALAEQVAQAVVAGGGKAVAVQADAREEDQVKAAAAKISAALGAPTRSASVIGIALFKPLLEMTLDDWRLDLGRNLQPAFVIGRVMAAEMIKAGQGGAMAFVSSISGIQSAARHAAYGAAKAGLMSLVQSMALELAPHGIRVNAVAPGAIRTVRTSAMPGNENVGRLIPLARRGEVEEIALPLVFLLSDMASYVTGQTIVSDGGWLIAGGPGSPLLATAH
ncbi:SDR family NAD(P)-dependent oxidoreductase [Phenylobacterium sp.]|uniref:SDR family NAD(P)-dependent oxidoreductase n=1 Tax=Phenylobacterium sp. TaxID=1871053 RepID=UPI002F41EDA9